MKTTINLDDQLLQAAKQRALDTNTSLKDVMEQALRQLLRPTMAVGVPIRTITFGKTGDAWTISPEQLRSAAYPEQNTVQWNKRMGLNPSDAIDTK
jgi:Bacterial antitoxin of type II TA system, VapB